LGPVSPEETITLGTVVLRLGALQADVVPKLKAQFRLSELTPSQHVVYLEPYNIVGLALFKNGRLVLACKHWYMDVETAYDAIVAINGAIASLKTTAKTCELQTGHRQEPQTLVQRAFIVCGHKYVELASVDSAQFRRQVQITEALEDYSWRPPF
jgi:hypothetical protein